MNSIPHSTRYLPHETSTRFHAVKLYRTGVGVKFVCRRYHISKASLMRWNKRFDGTWDSLLDHSHRPHTHHPNSHTDIEMKWIRDLHKRNPHISLLEMYGKLKTNKGSKRHPLSLYRVFVRLGFSSKAPFTKKTYVPKPYHTPDKIGAKFTHITKTDRIHPLDSLCQELGIEHKKIRPRTPRHNGKVERSHRNDQERFYNFLKFYSFKDLIDQMTRYRRRANNIPMQVLNWMSPIQKRKSLEQCS